MNNFFNSVHLGQHKSKSYNMLQSCKKYESANALHCTMWI